MHNEINTIIILGAGPAGLQMSYTFKQAGVPHIVLERSDQPGAAFTKFPVHRKLISINKVHTGFDKEDPINLRFDWHSLITEKHDLRFTDYSQEYFPDRSVYLQYLNDFTNRYELPVQYNTNITKIKKEDDLFQLETEQGEIITTKQLIVATGVSQAYLPAIPGLIPDMHYENLNLDKTKYLNKRVLILGKGNSGFETADHLIDAASLIHVVSPTPLKFAWKTHYVGHLRAVNNNFLDTYQLKSQNAMLNADISKIEKTGDQFAVYFKYKLANGEEEVIHYDHIIACTGFQFDTTIFDDSAKPSLTIKDRFPQMSSHYESENVPNLFFSGTIMQSRDFKKKQSGFVHGFRYNAEFLARYLIQKNASTTFKHDILPCKKAALTQQILTSINQSSALWQQSGFFCDVMVFNREMETVRYYRDFPFDYVTSEFLKPNDIAVIISLDYGQARIDQEPDVFAINRVHKQDVQNADQSTALHPILRLWHKTALKTHHILEDFESIWGEPEHVEPLTQFICDTIQYAQTVTQKDLVL